MLKSNFVCADEKFTEIETPLDTLYIDKIPTLKYKVLHLDINKVRLVAPLNNKRF